MRKAAVIAFFISSLSAVLATDLVAVYKHDILLIRNADTTNAGTSWESLKMDIPGSYLNYPIGLGYDPETNRLFVADRDHEDTKIFSIKLNSDHTIDEESVDSVVKKKIEISVVESISYDPRSRKLFWTDSYNHGVYKASVPVALSNFQASEPELAHDFGNVMKPRGITIDYCKEMLYWSERRKSDDTGGTIEYCSLNGTGHGVLREKRASIYYQGLSFDVTTGNLLWAETSGDDYKESSCWIKSFAHGKEETIVNVDNCYPFSLVADKDYIYWADLSREAIMRASRKDATDIKELVHTPSAETPNGHHFSAYGLVMLNGVTTTPIDSACKAVPEIDVTHNEEVGSTPEIDVTYNEEVGSTPSSNIVVSSPNLNIVNETKVVPTEATVSKGQKYKPQIVATVSSADHTKDADFSEDLGGSETGGDGAGDTVEVPNSPLAAVNDAKEKKIGSNFDHTVTTKSPSKSEYNSLDSDSNMLDLVTVSDSQMSADYEIESLKQRCNTYLAIIYVLIVLMAIFTCSTIILVILYCKGNPQFCKKELPIVNPQHATKVGARRQRKHFRPKFKPGLNGSASCSPSAGDDGVTIPIEDCCQLTVCETPCHTSLTKQGRGYVNKKYIRDQEDGRGLLEDHQDV